MNGMRRLVRFLNFLLPTSQRGALARGVLALGLVWLAGCQHTTYYLLISPPVCGVDVATGAPLTPQQVAYVPSALGQAPENRGEATPAAAMPDEAPKPNSDWADVCLGLAILRDEQGKFDESEGFYREALAAKPGSPDIYCYLGYSLCLQRRWAEAEMSLRQAIALQPDHQRAHNNLGLVLAYTRQDVEALREFGRAGCTAADAHCNLAFVLALERHWAEALSYYEHALVAGPALAPSQGALAQSDALTASSERHEGEEQLRREFDELKARVQRLAAQATGTGAAHVPGPGSAPLPPATAAVSQPNGEGHVDEEQLKWEFDELKARVQRLVAQGATTSPAIAGPVPSVTPLPPSQKWRTAGTTNRPAAGLR